MTTTRYECSACGGWIRSEGGEGDDPYDRDNVDTSETCGGCSPAEDRSDWWSDLECSECGSVLLNGEVPAGLCMGCEDYTEERSPTRADEREVSLPGGQQVHVGRGPDLTDEEAAHVQREERALNALVVIALRPDLDRERVGQIAAEPPADGTQERAS